MKVYVIKYFVTQKEILKVKLLLSLTVGTFLRLLLHQLHQRNNLRLKMLMMFVLYHSASIDLPFSMLL